MSHLIGPEFPQGPGGAQGPLCWFQRHTVVIVLPEPGGGWASGRGGIGPEGVPTTNGSAEQQGHRAGTRRSRPVGLQPLLALERKITFSEKS